MQTKSHILAAALTVSATLASLAGGCADGPIDSDNSMPESSLLAEAPLANGGTFRVYEPEPGVLIEFEQGPNDSASQPEPGEAQLNAAEKYTLLTGQPASARLVAAAAAVSQVTSPQGHESVDKELSADDISRPGLREDFLRLYCEKTDRFYWHLGYSKESLHAGDGINYYRWGVNAIQGPTAFVMHVWTFTSDQVLEKELPQGWYAGAVVKVGGAGAHVSSFAKPRGPAGLLDHCVNFHY